MVEEFDDSGPGLTPVERASTTVDRDGDTIDEGAPSIGESRRIDFGVMAEAVRRMGLSTVDVDATIDETELRGREITKPSLGAAPAANLGARDTDVAQRERPTMVVPSSAGDRPIISPRRSTALEQLLADQARHGEVFGDYHLLGSIGTGGMAEVRLAYSSQGPIERPCVIKRLSTAREADAEFREMFVEETRLGGLLRHPNIVQMLDAGQVDGRPYIALELVDGVNVGQLRVLCGDRPIPGSVVVSVGLDVARALAYAHDLCLADGTPLTVVHRDVSPQNILIARHGATKLADFGIARFDGRQHETEWGKVKGKLRYLAPEQFRGNVDRRSDIFSLGLVLAEMIAGELIFDTAAFDIEEPADEVQEALLDRRREIGEPLFELLARMTRGSPEQRPDHAGEVVKALSEIRDSMTVRVTPRAHLAEIFDALPSLVDSGFANAQTYHGGGGATELAHTYEPNAQPSYPTMMQVLFPDLFEQESTWGETTDGEDSQPEIVPPTAPPRRAVSTAAREYWLQAPLEDDMPTPAIEFTAAARYLEVRGETAVPAADPDAAIGSIPAPAPPSPTRSWSVALGVIIAVTLAVLGAMAILQKTGVFKLMP